MQRKSAAWRFGVFELDVDRHELRRNGRLVRPQEHPFHVLGARPGQEVSREELRKRLWPDASPRVPARLVSRQPEPTLSCRPVRPAAPPAARNASMPRT